MAGHGGHSLLKWFGIIIAVIVGVLILKVILLPLVGIVLNLLWGLSGIAAFILKIVIFVAFTIVSVLGVIMMISWVIREFTD